MKEQKLLLEVNAQNKYSFGRITQQIVGIVKGENSQAVVIRSGDGGGSPDEEAKVYSAKIDITNPVPEAVEALLQMELPDNIDLKIML